jgi:hypothetical protein
MRIYQPVVLKFHRPKTKSTVTIEDDLPMKLTDSERCSFVEIKYAGFFENGFSVFQIQFLEV